MKKDRRCKHCNQLFENIEGRTFSNHVKGCPENPNNSNKGSTREKISEKAKDNNEKRFGKFKGFEVKCHKCGVEFCIQEKEKLFPKKEKYFCSKSCSKSRTNSGPRTEKSRKKVSEKSKEKGKDPEYAQKVINSTINQNGNRIFNSVGERKVRDYFIKQFPDDKGTFGQIAKYKGTPLMCDLFSHELKVVIEYDGIWHFKDIHGQLKEKIRKDNLLEEGCKEKGYKLIRIDEDKFKKDENGGIDYLVQEAYNENREIVKIGEKYNY